MESANVNANAEQRLGFDLANMESAEEEDALHHAITGGQIHVVRANIFAEDIHGNDLMDCILQLYGSRVAQYHGRLALHYILRNARYSYADDDVNEDHRFIPPELYLLISIPLGCKKVTLSRFAPFCVLWTLN